MQMSSPHLSDSEVTAVQQVLLTRHLSMGPKLDAFENAFASYVGARFAVAVNSGTSGLHLAMIASKVEENDLVITTPFSFVASANSILYERGIPVFVDVDNKTGNIDPSLVEEAVKDLSARTRSARVWLPRNHAQNGMKVRALKAILPVHVFGQPAEMTRIVEAANAHGISVVEDACEAIGAAYKGRNVGLLANAAVFAFYPNKQITTGEGGMIVTDDKDWSNLFRSLRNQGRDEFGPWLRHDRLGYNYRMDEMSAALAACGKTPVNSLPHESTLYCASTKIDAWPWEKRNASRSRPTCGCRLNISPGVHPTLSTSD